MTERLIAAVIAKTPWGIRPSASTSTSTPSRSEEMHRSGEPLEATGRRVLCYATANVLRTEADAMVPKFADYGKEQTGQYPACSSTRVRPPTRA